MYRSQNSLNRPISVRCFHGHFDRIASKFPDKMVMRTLDGGGTETESISYYNLALRAKHVASQLQRKIQQGDSCVILFHPGIDFVVSFMACLYAGVIAIPAHPPRKNRRNDRLLSIITDAKPGCFLLSKEADGIINARGEGWIVPEGIPRLIIENPAKLSHTNFIPPNVRPDDVAMLQYTSGTTGEPSGVMITHAGLMHNSEVIKQAFAHDENLVGVTWLPPYHDMGLIGMLLQPLYVGGSINILNPFDFLRDPLLWLNTISTYRATTTGAPNFAFDLVAERAEEHFKQQIDLSSLKVMFCGSEKVRSESLENFAKAFQSSGFKDEMYLPCYGLAEGTLMLTGIHQSEPPSSLMVKNDHPANGSKISISENDDASITHMSCGYPWLDDEIFIVDPETLLMVPDDHIGEIWAKGKAISPGYWNKPEKSTATLKAKLNGREGDFLRTGDLGFIHEGNLYITGRIKELIIIQGVNHYPGDIGDTVEKCHFSLQARACAAFSAEVGNSEKLVIMQEIKRTAIKDLHAEEVVFSIRKAIATDHEISVHAIVLVKPGGIYKTTSGKIQHNKCREMWVKNSVKAIHQWVNEYKAPEGLITEIHKDEFSIEMITDWLSQWLGHKIKIDPSEIDPDEPILSYGLDSMAAVELEREAKRKFGIELHPLDMLENNTISALARIGFESISNITDHE